MTLIVSQGHDQCIKITPGLNIILKKPNVLKSISG